jgi:Zn-dependent protease with chaperone function
MTAIPSGEATFFDGVTAARRRVRLALDADALRIADPRGEVLAVWPWNELEHVDAPAGVFRLGLVDAPRPARLDVTDEALAHAIDLRSEPVDRTGGVRRRERVKVVAWALAAIVSLVGLAVYAMPVIADRLAPDVPVSWEMRIGFASDRQIRATLDRNDPKRPFECGLRADEQAGLAAFSLMVSRIERASSLHVPVRARVVRMKQANAFALPAGYIYVYEGLIAKSEHPDELAGVIAHELGHVANRDGLRSMIQAAGVSVLFGMVLGDFFGGGALVTATKGVLNSRYSRSVESQADRFAVDVMRALGADPRRLGTILLRIAGGDGGGIFVDHPGAKDRDAAISAAAGRAPATQPVVDAATWAALKTVCAPLPTQ